MKGPRNLLPLGMLVLIAMFFMFDSPILKASDIYIAQNSAGSINGSDCADAYAVTWFNTGSNWGSNSGQIGPGTTVHLCGTFNAPAASNGYLTFQGSGSSGSPITLIAEAGAMLQAPYWGQNGAINTAGHQYITLNGNHNGTIQATANGTNLANQAPNCGGNLVCTSGIYAADCANCIIENWTVANIYVNVGPGDESVAGQGSFGIYYADGNNTTISGNTVHDAKWGITMDFCGNSNYTVSSNTIYDIDHGVAIFDDNSNCSLTNLIASGNTIHDFANWDDNADGNHHDGFHFATSHSGSTISNIQNFNNYLYGDPGANGNAAWFMEGNPGKLNTLQIFNNLYVNSSATHTWADSVINEGIGNSGILIANNTLVGSTTSQSGSTCNGGTCANIAIQTNDSSGNGANVQNNIIMGFNRGVVVVPGSSMPTLNYNDFYNLADVADGPSGNLSSTLAAWQGSCSCDANSTAGNPNLNGSYQLSGSSSAAWQTGTNLASLGITNLDSDRAGVARPSAGSGNWDMGAFNSSGGGGGGTTQAPNPPAGLAAQVQ